VLIAGTGPVAELLRAREIDGLFETRSGRSHNPLLLHHVSVTVKPDTDTSDSRRRHIEIDLGAILGYRVDLGD